MTTFRVLVTARFRRSDGTESVADSMHVVPGVKSEAEAETIARREARLAGVDVVRVRVAAQGRRRRGD